MTMPLKHKPAVIGVLLFCVLLLSTHRYHWGYFHTCNQSVSSSSTPSEYPTYNTDTLNDHVEYDELVMVPGHAIWTPENEWDTSPDRIDQLPILMKQVSASVIYTNANKKRFLLFSGGQTHANLGPVSEGYAYWNYANQKLPSFPSTRASSEEFARDSYENLVFSVCRFREIAGNLPKKITVFGFSFKEKRFVELHRTAIGFPQDKFFYKSVDENFTEGQLEDIKKSEYENAYKWFVDDPWGCQGALFKKKISRNPFHRMHGIYGYSRVCPELKQILEKCEHQE